MSRSKYNYGQVEPDWNQNGPWRDGTLVVSTVHCATTPWRCIVTNAASDLETESFTLYDEGERRGFQVVTVMLGYLSGFLFAGLVLSLLSRGNASNATIDFAVSRGVSTRRMFVNISVAFAMVSLAVGILYLASTPSPPIDGAWLTILGIVVLMAGIAFPFARTNRPPLRAVKWDRDLVWIAGAGKDFVSSLPELPESRRA